MYIPKIGLTHIFFETLQNFQGERLSKIYGIRQKKRHDLPPLQKTGIIIPSNGHPVRFASDRISKILFSCQALCRKVARALVTISFRLL